MKKVLIIAPSDLPVPAVKGGAVETGINQILDENEKVNNIHIDVISYYDEIALRKSREYKNSDFLFYKPKFLDIFLCNIIKVINKIFRKIGIKKNINIRPLFIRFIYKNIELQKYDSILIKNAVNYILPLSRYTTNNLYLQLHNDFLNKNTPNASKIVSKCELIITNSKYIKNQVLTINDIKEKNILINMNCLDDYSFRKAKKQKREELFFKYNINNDCKVIFFSGRMVKEKGIKELLYAVRKLDKKKNWKLLIAGSKWFSSNKKNKFIRELEDISSPISENIVFLGYVPHSEISYFNSIADVVVIPSIWEEPAGRVALEAAAVGTPVIIANSGGLKEYIEPELSKVINKDDHFVDNLSNAISEIIYDEKFLSPKDKRHLIDYAKKFNSERYYKEIMTYIKVLEE